MIDPKELQLGNYVTDEFYESSKNIIEIDSINDKGINLVIEDDGRWAEIAQTWIAPEYYTFDKLRGIPLTEDILIRCGFTRHKVTMSAADMWQGMDGWSLGDSGWLFRGNLKSGGLRLVGYFNTQIFYLHQLQNLVKLLCNQTIELK